MIKTQKKEEGLTMIELLATIAILVATVTAVLSLGNRAVSQSILYATHSEATFLAKEGMEILEDENIRERIKEEGEESFYWRVDFIREPGEISSTSQNNCYSKLRIKGSAEYYGFYAIGAPSYSESSFARCIISDYDGEKLKIEVDTTFEHRGREYSVNLYRVFYD
jgi:hypothetical protein